MSDFVMLWILSQYFFDKRKEIKKISIKINDGNEIFLLRKP